MAIRKNNSIDFKFLVGVAVFLLIGIYFQFITPLQVILISIFSIGLYFITKNQSKNAEKKFKKGNRSYLTVKYGSHSNPRKLWYALLLLAILLFVGWPIVLTNIPNNISESLGAGVNFLYIFLVGVITISFIAYYNKDDKNGIVYNILHNKGSDWRAIRIFYVIVMLLIFIVCLMFFFPSFAQFILKFPNSLWG